MSDGNGEPGDGKESGRPTPFQTGLSVRLTVRDAPVCSSQGWATVFPWSPEMGQAVLSPLLPSPPSAQASSSTPPSPRGYLEQHLPLLPHGLTHFPLRVATHNPDAEQYRLRQLAEFGSRLRGGLGSVPEELFQNMSELAAAGEELLPRQVRFHQGDDAEDDALEGDDDDGDGVGDGSGDGETVGEQQSNSKTQQRIRWLELRWQIQVEESY